MHTYALLFLTLAAAALRVGQLNAPLSYDEAYTYIGFASHDLWGALSDYSLPNNHILHTALVWGSAQVFGNAPWLLRMPAFLAGILLVPAAYGMATQLYNRPTGLVAAALVAWFPELIHYSTEARGYSLLSLFTLLSIWLGAQAVQKDSNRAWARLSIVTALGFWTLPLMLYPAGGVYLWLGLEMTKKRQTILRWLGSGIAALSLTVILYLPALWVSGWRRILANGFVQPVEAQKYFDWVLKARLQDTWATWMQGVPPILAILLVLGGFLSLALHRQSSTTRLPLLPILLVWVTTLLLLRRPEAFDRFWAWLIAPALVWAASGLLQAAKQIRVGGLHGQKILPGAAILLLLPPLWGAAASTPKNWQKMGNQQAAAQYIAQHWQPGDQVLVGYPNNPQVWYYLLRQGVEESAWQAHPGAERTWLLLATNQKDQTLQSIVKAHGLQPTDVNTLAAAPVQQYGKIAIYLSP
jgi:4-amino-4-deoxy-L-arabinose transferase-like glycosyltransferase